MKTPVDALRAKTRPRGRTTDRAEFDRLNKQQGAMWLAGQDNTPEYEAILARMREVAPPGYGFLPGEQ